MEFVASALAISLTSARRPEPGSPRRGAGAPPCHHRRDATTGLRAPRHRRQRLRCSVRPRERRGRAVRHDPCGALLSGVRPWGAAARRALSAIKGPAMVRHSQSTGAFVCPSGSAFDGGAQPGCIHEHLRRGRHSTLGVRARRTTAFPWGFAPVSPAPRSPKSRAIGRGRS